MQHSSVRQRGRGKLLVIKSHEYQEVISALTELQGWIKDYKGYYDQIDGIIKELGNPEMSDLTRQRIKHELSHDMLFHVRCLGDVYVKDFPQDGTGSPWFNYLDKLCRLCQEKLE